MIVALGAELPRICSCDDSMANLRGKIYDFREPSSSHLHPAYLLAIRAKRPKHGKTCRWS